MKIRDLKTLPDDLELLFKVREENGNYVALSIDAAHIIETKDEKMIILSSNFKKETPNSN